MAASPVWPFVEAGGLSGGGALRGTAAGLPPSLRPQLRGAALRVFPEPEAVERQLRLLVLLRALVLRSRSRAITAMQGGGSFELRAVDFPSARGLLPFQGHSGGAAAARRRIVFFGAVVFFVLTGLDCNFSFLVDCSVRFLG
jgi:hypothetical protein